MTETRLAQLSRLWDEFRALGFPSGFYQREPDGQCMVMMDSMLAGCVSSALSGPLNDRRRGILQTRIVVLGQILPSIGDDEYAAKYFAHLHEMVLMAAEIDNARRE
ncbi:hypothetical protein MCM47_38530 [Kitasatospora sp. A2-31]|nr:hypothetical protein [Kitasatospora sp. A2-31]